MDISDRAGRGEHHIGGNLPRAVLQQQEALVDGITVEQPAAEDAGLKRKIQPIGKLPDAGGIGGEFDDQRRDAVRHQTAVDLRLVGEESRVQRRHQRRVNIVHSRLDAGGRETGLVESEEGHLNRHGHQHGMKHHGVEDVGAGAVGQDRDEQGLVFQHTGAAQGRQ